MAWNFRDIEWSRDIDIDGTGLKTSSTTGPRGLIGSLESKDSPGLVVAVRFLLRSGTEAGASSTADLGDDCLVDFIFANFLWVLNPIVVFTMTDLPIKSFCDTRRLWPCNDLIVDLRPSFEQPGNGERRAGLMFGDSTGLKALGVSGNVWLIPERADGGECTPKSSRDPVSTEILDDLGCAKGAWRLDLPLPLRSAMTMLSSRSGLGRPDEPDRLAEPALVNADGMAALSGKAGSREMW